MNDKINFQKLVDLFAEKNGMKGEEAQLFLKEFFRLIEEALEKERYVKVKGWGTFKLVNVESRESVNVNTGERCVLPGHAKITFTPETAIRDLINKPFAHFESVVLNEKTVFEDMTETVDEDDAGLSAEDEVMDDNATESTDSETTVELADGAEFCEVVESEDVTESAETIESTKVVISSEETEIPDSVETGVDPDTSDTSVALNNLVALEASETPEVASELKVDEVEENQAVAFDDTGCDDMSTKGECNEKKLCQVDDADEVEMPCRHHGLQRWHAVSLLMVVILLLGGLVCRFGLYGNYDYVAQIVGMDELLLPESDHVALLVEDSIDRIATKVDINDTVVHKNEECKKIQDIVSHVQVETKNIVESSDDVLAQKLTPVIPDSTSCKIVGTRAIHVVKPGETLTRVALKYYGTKNLWPYLVMYNRKVIANPDNVSVGTTLHIPSLVKKE